MRGLFAIGAGGAYNPGVTGGAATHLHGAGTLVNGVNSAAEEVDYDLEMDTTFVAAHTHIHDITGDTANGSTLPPYRALNFIMKL